MKNQEYNITKLCADSLRSFLNENHGIRLKSGHAHEIVAAFFGYKSKISLLADKMYPLTNLEKSKFIILNPLVSFVDQRIKCLEGFSLNGLSPDLLSSDTLTQVIYSVIASNKRLLEKIRPSFDKLAIAIAEERVQQRIGIFRMNPAPQWIIDVKTEITEAATLLNVSFAYSGAERKHSRCSTVDVKFPRIAGNIGYGMPEVMHTFYSGQCRDPDFNHDDFGVILSPVGRV